MSRQPPCRLSHLQKSCLPILTTTHLPHPSASEEAAHEVPSSPATSRPRHETSILPPFLIPIQNGDLLWRIISAIDDVVYPALKAIRRGDEPVFGHCVWDLKQIGFGEQWWSMDLWYNGESHLLLLRTIMVMAVLCYKWSRPPRRMRMVR